MAEKVSGLHRSGIWTVLLGTAMIFGQSAAEDIKNERMRNATKDAISYATVALGVTVNTRKTK
jgi:hypothetical protein